MILIVTTELTASCNVLVELMRQRNIAVFRFNLDLFPHYRFLWTRSHYIIRDPCNKIFSSCETDAVVCYKAILSYENYAEFEADHNEGNWLKSWMNSLYCNLVKHASDMHTLKLWQPWEENLPKTWQMKVAEKYFKVPDFYIFWGEKCNLRKLITKPLTARSFSDRTHMFAKIIDSEELDPHFPWFTQKIADGNRDATVVYINGHVHCYRFATERGNLTDWRVTQGTERNKWEKWDAGKEFEQKVDAYMKELGLKFGRLDFIIGGKEPQFLEVNPCGQFGWLDDEKLTLHNEVVDAILDPSSTVTI